MPGDGRACLQVVGCQAAGAASPAGARGAVVVELDLKLQARALSARPPMPPALVERLVGRPASTGGIVQGRCSVLACVRRNAL